VREIGALNGLEAALTLTLSRRERELVGWEFIVWT
jgi:hypothetical protein